MGFVKRNLELEEYLDKNGVVWSQLSDSEYNRVLRKLDEIIEKGGYISASGDDAFSSLENKLPCNGFIFSAPRHKLFSVYSSGGDNKTIGYVIEGLYSLERDTLNHIECVVSNNEVTYACAFNHEWQAHCPEVYIEKNV